jgi:hypothetical protein
MVSWQTHPTSGIPHLDILLVYKKAVMNSMNHYNYLLKHGELTRYSKLNDAILTYGTKQDPSPLISPEFNPLTVINQKRLIDDPYIVMYDQMIKAPFTFDVHAWLKASNLHHVAARTHWQKAVALLKKQQEVQCNELLFSKPCFKRINQAQIASQLSPSERVKFYSWYGYQVIVDHLNQVLTHGSHRPFKTKNLLLVGPTHIGKTSLFSEPYHPPDRISIQDCVSVYHMGMKHWFPKYKSGVYKIIFWDQFKLTAYPYDLLLKFFQGSPVDLPYHGGATKKDDNPLIVMTSNLPLARHLQIKFTNPYDRQIAAQNLASRVTQLVVPPGFDLFFLQKLITINLVENVGTP